MTEIAISWASHLQTKPRFEAATSYVYVVLSSRNPLRKHLNTLSSAIVEANKLNPPDPAESLEWVREGAEAARVLADELARAVKRMEESA